MPRRNLLIACVFASLAALAVPASAAALDLDNPFPAELIVSPGVKLGYTFGAQGGFNYGIEISVLTRTTPDLAAVLAYGPVFNLHWGPNDVFYARLGAEVVSWFIGAEAGVAYVSDSFGSHFGVGITPWIGSWYVVPYYTHTFVFGSTDLNEAGTYLKLPLCPACSSSGNNFDWDED